MSYHYQSRIDKDILFLINMGKYYRNCYSYQGFNENFRVKKRGE
jgi:hypothetical protein